MIIEIRKTFDVFDVECEGKIPVVELENALRVARLNPTPTDLDTLKQRLGNPDAFRCFDPAGRGYISKEQLREIVAPLLGEELPEVEFQAIIDGADLDGDGKIDIEEFVAFMMGD
ncbi:CALM-like protein [Mya arenaria]|uniref:CALM-like protein n=1 Tax=Mya arenaria TaxID=6604 RepID=A0ABY7FA98_MYAAR|nr:CALM-like protein [Mya arenaria]